MPEKSKPKDMDYVAVEYTGKFTDGEIFDSSEGREPLTFQVGAGMVIPGFDKAVKALAVGESKEVKIKAKEGYGERNKDEVEVPKSAFQDKGMIQKGVENQIMTNMGPMLLEITKIDKDSVKAILNHPLAGKELVFNIKLVKILSKKEVTDLEKKSACSCCTHEECDCN